MTFATALTVLVVAGPTPLVAADFAETPHTYPPEDAVRYSRPFVEAHSEAVCADSEGGPAFPGNARRSVVSAEGARYLLGPAVDGGSFGLFRLALDANGTAWGVKEFHDSMPAPVVSEAALRREFGLWEHVGRGVMVRDVLHDVEAQSTLVVMTLLDGNVATLANMVADSPQLARAVLKQVAGDATELHALGFVHNDLRAANLFWDRNGRIILADYGIAQHVEADGRLERAPWQVVLEHAVGVGIAPMVVAPEVMVSRYDARADMWGLGIAALSALLPQTSAGYALGDELAVNAAGYAAWRNTLLNRHGEVDLTCVLDPTRQSVPARHFVFHAAFYAAKQRDPALTQRLLQHMLVPDPAQRWTAEELVQATMHEGPSEADLAPLFEGLADANVWRQMMLDGLRACAQSLEPASMCEAPRAGE